MFSGKVIRNLLLNMIIKVSQIYNATKGTKQDFDLEFKAEDFADLPFKGAIKAEGYIMRVQEGVMMMIEKLDAVQVAECVRCGKTLNRKIDFTPQEWLFYEQKPLLEDDENEHLVMDKTRIEIDPYEPIRQELVLNMDNAPRCAKLCKTFKDPEPGIKALSGLKDLVK